MDLGSKASPRSTAACHAFSLERSAVAWDAFERRITNPGKKENLMIVYLVRKLSNLLADAIRVRAERGFRLLMRRRTEPSYCTTTGTVERLDTLQISSRGIFFPSPSTYKVVVTFSYNVNGEYYSGREERDFRQIEVMRKFVSLLCAEMLKDSPNGRLVLGKVFIPIGVKPDRPERSIIFGFFESPEKFAARLNECRVLFPSDSLIGRK